MKGLLYCGLALKTTTLKHSENTQISVMLMFE